MTDGTDEARVRARGTVSGRVQGVWFRESTRRCAAGLGLSGWVRNLADGRVEAEFVGPRGAVERALEFVGEGPPHARVERVEGFEIEALDEADASAVPPGGEAFLIR